VSSHHKLTSPLFLLLLRIAQCPSLLVPQTYGLVKEHTHAKTHRTLILIAKVLQNLANKNDFSGKEEFMEVMNGFIERNVGKVQFTLHVSKVYYISTFLCLYNIYIYYMSLTIFMAT
jgi:hypothetical protein